MSLPLRYLVFQFLFLLIYLPVAQAQNQYKNQNSELNQNQNQIDQQAIEKLRSTLTPFYKPIDLPKPDAQLKKQIALGERLFFDRRLDRLGRQVHSCQDCHDLSQYGTNGKQARALLEKGKLKRDVPPLYNMIDYRLYGWDGRYKTLEEMTKEAVQGEHGLVGSGKQGRQELQAHKGHRGLETLKQDLRYQKAFTEAFPDSAKPIELKNIISALSRFQERLVTKASIDAFILGDDEALTAKQIQGGLHFDRYNCASCHTGRSYGGQMHHKLGIVVPWANQKDKGYAAITGQSAHDMVFRVAPLRNVSATKPYFHDASSTRLWQAVKRMGEAELGMRLELRHAFLIGQFLEAFRGEIPERYQSKGEAKSGSETESEMESETAQAPASDSRSDAS